MIIQTKNQIQIQTKTLIKMNYYLKRIEGNLFVLCEEDKPKKEDYISDGNNALVSEDYFLDMKKYEASRKTYECNFSQIGDFIKLVTSKENYSIADLNLDLDEGTLIPEEKIEIKKVNEFGDKYAFVMQSNRT